MRFIPKACEEITGIMKALLVERNKEYSLPEEEFFNFELASKLTGLEVEEVILNQAAIKFARLRAALRKNRVAGTVFTDDSIKDLIGYVIILKAYLDRRSDAESDPKSVG